MRGLASAAVILSLAACGSDDDDGGGPIDGGEDTVVDGGDTDGAGGDGAGGDGAGGDTGGDGNGGDGNAGGNAGFDEAIDGDIAGDASNPQAVQVGEGSNLINGSVVAGDIDYVTINVPAGSVLSAINLVSYESVDDQSFIGIQEGTTFTEPPEDTVVGNLLGFTLMGDADVGTDILQAIGSGDGAQGFTGPLAAGDYTFWIQETGDDASTYSLDMVISPVSSSPAVGAIYALTNQHDPSVQISAADDAPSEPDRINQVVAYSRAADGALQQIGIYDTGGVGENIRASGANPLASQDPLIVSKDNRFVFAVNAGSESISSFVINDDYSLTAASLDVSTSGTSGAQNPVSLTIFENTLYVANTGNYTDGDGAELDSLPDDRTRTNSSIIGFTVGDDGSLTPLAGSEIVGIAANAGSIEFSSNGQFLYVTERRTNNILTINLDANRVPVNSVSGSLASITPQPFGTDLYPTENGDILLVSEGNNGAPGLSALSSYLIEDSGNLSGISLSSGVAGDPLTTGFTFGCWVEFVETPNGDFAFVSNTPDGTITSFEVGDQGGLTRLQSEAGNAGIGGDDTQNGGGVLDAEIAFPYLYQVVNNDGRIAQFFINEEGGLDRQLSLEIVDTELFRAGMFVGVAGF